MYRLFSRSLMAQKRDSKAIQRQSVALVGLSLAAREALRSYTPARVALERTGVSLPTGPLLDLQLAHARARDAVHAAIDVRMLCDELRRSGLAALALDNKD